MNEPCTNELRTEGISIPFTDPINLNQLESLAAIDLGSRASSLTNLNEPPQSKSHFKITPGEKDPHNTSIEVPDQSKPAPHEPKNPKTANKTNKTHSPTTALRKKRFWCCFAGVSLFLVLAVLLGLIVFLPRNWSQNSKTQDMTTALLQPESNVTVNDPILTNPPKIPTLRTQANITSLTNVSNGTANTSIAAQNSSEETNSSKKNTTMVLTNSQNVSNSTNQSGVNPVSKNNSSVNTNSGTPTTSTSSTQGSSTPVKEVKKKSWFTSVLDSIKRFFGII